VQTLETITSSNTGQQRAFLEHSAHQPGSTTCCSRIVTIGNMAELALGVVSLAGLFNNAADNYGYIRLGQHYARDFETNQTKLDLSRLQLSRWGAARSLMQARGHTYTAPHARDGASEHNGDRIQANYSGPVGGLSHTYDRPLAEGKGTQQHNGNRYGG
jgi:hypothetical protein